MNQKLEDFLLKAMLATIFLFIAAFISVCTWQFLREKTHFYECRQTCRPYAYSAYSWDGKCICDKLREVR